MSPSGDLVNLLRLVVIGGHRLLQVDRHLGDRAGERERYRVGLGDGCTFIRAHVGAFVRRERATLGAVVQPMRARRTLQQHPQQLLEDLSGRHHRQHQGSQRDQGGQGHLDDRVPLEG
jgi:hypothetical protein